MGCMGYSIPAAMGAKFCEPDKQVVAVCGDGSFQMSMYELGTLAVNKIPLKILVMKNRYLGLVREYQHYNYQDRYSGVRLHDYPYYDKIAEAYDMKYFEASDNESMPGIIDEFLASEGSAIMVCNIDSQDITK